MAGCVIKNHKVAFFSAWHKGSCGRRVGRMRALKGVSQPARPPDGRLRPAPDSLLSHRLPLPQFCYTGGYIEAGLQFPGDDYISGFCECRLYHGVLDCAAAN